MNALAGFEEPNAAAKHREFTKQLLDDCAEWLLGHPEDDDGAGSVKISDALVDPCFASLEILEGMLGATADQPWDVSSTVLCESHKQPSFGWAPGLVSGVL